MSMCLATMSREQWETIFQRWYRHAFGIGVHGEGPSLDLIERCYGLGVSPAEAVDRLKNPDWTEPVTG